MDTVVAGHYRVRRRIGSGAMGVVWLAQDERLGRPVAIKQLLLQPGATEGETELARKRAMREARIAAMLQHPNAVTIYDVVELDGYPCLVMEYVPSRSLADLMDERGWITPAEAAGIGSQIASALAAAHEKGIVHRDVKPGNLLLGESGTAKITDFGISRAAGDMTLTQTGIVAGTPAYFAPEVARGQDPSPASDVYSLASTLYAAVEGEPPYGNTQNAFAMLHSVAAGQVEMPRQAGTLTALLMRMLRKDPGERPTMAQVRDDLARVADGGIPPDPAPVAQPWPVQRPHTAAMPAAPPAGGTAAGPARSRRMSRALSVALGVGALVLAGVLVAVFTLTSGGGNGGSASGRAAAPPPSDSAAPSSSAPPSRAPVPAKTAPQGGPVSDWHAAGVVVIDFYNGLNDPASAWRMLSPHAQSLYGSEQKFAAYWKRYQPVSADNAFGVKPAPDGAVTVPVDVHFGYGSGQTGMHKVLRVTRVNGNLVIDSDTRR